jgi:TM2 domain-containing membrane protein YozV
MSTGAKPGRGKDKMIAGLLGLLLGSLGVHHFYLGSTTLGIIYLCVTLFTCGTFAMLPAAGGLIEGILLLTMSDDDFNARYNYREPEGMEFVFQKKP